MKKVMFISSTGGHLSELMQLKPLFKNYDYYIVTEKNDTTIKLKNEYEDRIYYLIYGARNYMLSYMIKFPLNIIKSFYLFLKINPQVMLLQELIQQFLCVILLSCLSERLYL